MSKRGNYLLEFAAVLAVLLPLLLGAIDVNTALQGYTAVHAGAATAARCVFPTDAACVNSAAYSPPAALFNWYRGVPQQNYFVRYDNYSGTGYWLNAPRYTWKSYQAQVYTSASYDLPQQEYQAFDQQITIRQPLEIATQLASLPYVTGIDPENPTGFVYRGNAGAAFDGALAVSLQNATVKSGVPGVIEITPPAWANTSAYKSLACFKTNGFDQGGDNSPNVKTNCDRVPGTSASFPVAFWIGGKARGGVGGAIANLTLTMRYLAAGGTWHALDAVDLGGQEFSAPGTGSVSQENFHPRGFGSDGADAAMLNKIQICTGVNCGFPEWAQNSIIIPAEARKIQILVVPAPDFAGSLEYTIDSAKAFAPIYATAQITAQCSAPDCDGANSCAPSYQGQTFGAKGAIKTAASIDALSTNAAALLLSAPQITTKQTPFGASKPFTSDTTAINSFSAASQRCDVAVEATGPAPVLHISSKNCAVDQYGALPGLPDGCGVETTATNITYTTSWTSVPQTALEKSAFDWNFSWQKKSCTDVYTPGDFAAPAGLRRYANYEAANFISTTPSVTMSPIETLAGADPRPLILPGGSYACGDFSVGSEQFEGDGANPVPTDRARQTLFAGTHPEYLNTPGCSTAVLRKEAESLGLPGYAYFEPHAVFVDEQQSTQPPSAPECIAYRTESSYVGLELAAQNVPQGSAPQGCPSADCYALYSGINASSGTAATYDLGKAQNWGEQELSSSYPRANYSCAKDASDPDCAWVVAAQTNDEVTVTAKLNVPFYFLGRKTFPLTQTLTRKLERSFAD